jgi:hypothetical protein
MPLALALVPKSFPFAPESAAFFAHQHSAENCWDPLLRSPIARREKTDKENQNFTNSFRKSQSNAAQHRKDVHIPEASHLGSLSKNRGFPLL